MRIRKDYTITILGFRNLAVVTKPNNKWVKWLQRNATCGCTIIDLNSFNSTMAYVRFLKKQGVEVIIRK